MVTINVTMLIELRVKVIHQRVSLHEYANEIIVYLTMSKE